MQSKVKNLDEIIDQSLKTASIVISAIAFPALIRAGYRNLFIDDLHFNQLVLTLCYALFLFIAIGKTKSKQFSIYATILISSLLF